jgi:hypothetical protein
MARRMPAAVVAGDPPNLGLKAPRRDADQRISSNVADVLTEVPPRGVKTHVAVS